MQQLHYETLVTWFACAVAVILIELTVTWFARAVAVILIELTVTKRIQFMLYQSTLSRVVSPALNVAEICRIRKIRYKHRSFQDALYELILTGKASMNSGKLRHEMSMLLDYLHIKFKFTTVGTTGGNGSQVGWKYGGRDWSMTYIFDCIRKKKIGKQNILDVGTLGFAEGVDVEDFAECITRPGITFEEFEDLSIAMFWANPYYNSAYCPYGYIRVNIMVRVLELDVISTPPSVLALLSDFITNEITFRKKAAKARALAGI